MSNFSNDGAESKSLDRVNNTEFTKWRGKKNQSNFLSDKGRYVGLDVKIFLVKFL